MLYWSGQDETEKDIQFKEKQIEDANAGWSYEDENGNSCVTGAPAFLKKEVEKNEPLVLEKVFSDADEKSNYMAIRTIHMKLKVYVEDRLVYQYGDTSSDIFTNPPNAWHVFSLGESPKGKKIRVELTSVLDKYNGTVSNMYIGDKSTLILHIANSGKISLFMCCILASLGFFLFIIWIFARRLFRNNALLYLSFFSFVVCAWSLGETKMLQFFTGELQVVSILAFEALMLVPFPMLLYFLESIRDKQSKIYRANEIVFFLSSIVFILNNALQIAGIKDMSETVVITHCEMLVAAVVVVFSNRYNIMQSQLKKQSVLSRASVIGLIIFLGTIFVDIIKYYTKNYGDSGFYSRFGLIVYIFTLGVDSVDEGLRMVNLGKKARQYRDLAYHDQLTGAMSRSAYEESLDRMEKEGENVFLMAIDINNLKKINDTKGHEAGDEYLKSNIDYIMSTFHSVGNCYRIGGDEFVVVCKKEADFKKCQEQIDTRLANPDEKVDFSYGYAVYNKETSQSIREAVSIADKKLYECKRRMKEKQYESGTNDSMLY